MEEAREVERHLRDRGYGTKDEIVQALGGDPEIVNMALKYLTEQGVLGHVRYEAAAGIGDLYYVRPT